MKEHKVNVRKTANGHELHDLDRPEGTEGTEVHVNGGDSIKWSGNSEIVDFKDSPFEDGSGGFKPGTLSRIKTGLPKGKHFPCSATQGEIIVDNP